MYMFGFAASFNDTIVHFTNVMEVDSVWYDTKTKFLLGRDHYSRQLKDYLATKENLPQRTCVTIFAKTRSKAEKKLVKLRRLYTQSKDGKAHFDIRYVEDNAFRYHSVNILDYEDENADTSNKKASKKQKSKNKKKSVKRGK
jgi:hypothetical protein